MIEKLIKITFWTSIILLAATFIFIAKSYYDACEEKKNEIYNLMLEVGECREQLEIYQEGSILWDSEEYKVIRIDK